jgi:hypothetical protein
MYPLYKATSNLPAVGLEDVFVRAPFGEKGSASLVTKIYQKWHME